MPWFLVLLAACASLAACLHSCETALEHLRNYRRPDLQRYTLRIIWMVPLFAVACLFSLSSHGVLAHFIDAIRDIYEAIVIYSFFTLLVGYLGGERALLDALQKRLAVHHIFPLNLILPPLEMRRPETFLAVRRGILQFVLTKPILAIITLLLKSLNVYREGVISVGSPYLWVTIFYNVSVMVAFYCLAIFYLQCATDLAPFHPIPKFVCVKALIFLTWYQGIAIALLAKIGWLPDITSQNEATYPDHDALVAVKFQNFLICLELPLLSKMHRIAFPYQEFSSIRTKHTARIKFLTAVRDAFGVKDLVQDAYHTFIKGTTFSSRTIDNSYISNKHVLSSNIRQSLSIGASGGSSNRLNSPEATGEGGKRNVPRGNGNAYVDSAGYSSDVEVDEDGDAVPDSLKRQARRKRKKLIRKQRRILVFGADTSVLPSDEFGSTSANSSRVYGAGNFFTADDFGPGFNNPRWWSYDNNVDFYRRNAQSSGAAISEDPEAIMNLLDWTDVEFSSPSSDPETETLYKYTKQNLDFGDANYPVVPDPYVGPAAQPRYDYVPKSRRGRPQTVGTGPSSQNVATTDTIQQGVQGETSSTADPEQTLIDVDDHPDELVDPFADFYTNGYATNIPSHDDTWTQSNDALTAFAENPLGALSSAGNHLGHLVTSKILPITKRVDLTAVRMPWKNGKKTPSHSSESGDTHQDEVNDAGFSSAPDLGKQPSSTTDSGRTESNPNDS